MTTLARSLIVAFTLAAFATPAFAGGDDTKDRKDDVKVKKVDKVKIKAKTAQDVKDAKTDNK